MQQINKNKIIEVVNYNLYKEYSIKLCSSLERQKEEFFIKDYDKFKEGFFNVSLYGNLAKYMIFKDICLKFDLIIYKLNLNFVSHIILSYKKHFIYICLNGYELRTLNKVSNKLSYFCNGQITKGYLKGNKKEQETLKEINKFYNFEINKFCEV